MTVQTVSLKTISGILVMDNHGKRLFAKYYDGALVDQVKQQHTLERQLHDRTRKQTSSTYFIDEVMIGFEQNEVAMIDGYIAVYRCNMDVGVFVLGEPSSNELLLACVLDAIFGSFEDVLKPQIDKRSVIDHFEQVCLIIDETVDRGIILETDPLEIVSRVQRKSDINANEGMSPISSESAASALSGMFSFAKEKIARTILKQ